MAALVLAGRYRSLSRSLHRTTPMGRQNRFIRSMRSVFLSGYDAPVNNTAPLHVYDDDTRETDDL